MALLTTGYSLERVTLSNLKRLIPLYKNAFRLDLTHEFIEKKFRCNTNKKDTLAFMAHAEDGVVVAYYSVIPCIVNYNNSEMLAVQSCDAMTHRNHRGKGLFPLLGKAVHDLARDEGARFIFGFPNPFSYHVLVNKMKFQHADTMKAFCFRVMTLPVAKLMKKAGMLKQYRQWGNKSLKKYEAVNKSFRNSVLDNETGGVERSENYVSYKTYSGCVVTEIFGLKVWLKIENTMQIGDMERTDKKTFLQVISQLKKICVPLGLSEIIFTVAPDTYFEKMMTGLNIPFKEKNAILYWDFDSGFDLRKIRFTGADNDIF